MLFEDISLTDKSDFGVLPRIGRVQNLLDHMFLLDLYGYWRRGRNRAVWEGILSEKIQEGDMEHREDLEDFGSCSLKGYPVKLFCDGR